MKQEKRISQTISMKQDTTYIAHSARLKQNLLMRTDGHQLIAQRLDEKEDNVDLVMFCYKNKFPLKMIMHEVDDIELNILPIRAGSSTGYTVETVTDASGKENLMVAMLLVTPSNKKEDENELYM